MTPNGTHATKKSRKNPASDDESKSFSSSLVPVLQALADSMKSPPSHDASILLTRQTQLRHEIMRTWKAANDETDADLKAFMFEEVAALKEQLAETRK
jgi:hypothetical protein